MSDKESQALALLDQAMRLLEEARTFDDIKSVRNKANAARMFVRDAKLGLDFQNRIAELRLRAERMAGAYLAGLKLRGGDRRSKLPRVTLKLEDLGVSRHQSRRWQKVALVSEEELAEYVRNSTQLGREATTAGLLKMMGKERPKRRRSDRASTMKGPHFLASSFHVNETFDELQNHCQVLDGIFRPLYQGEVTKVARSQLRLASRLFPEVIEMLQQLKHEWAALERQR